MPEGPELHLSSRFINRVCRGRIFGKTVKSEISKNPVVERPSEKYTISASSRGKEIKLSLTEHINGDKCNNNKASGLALKSINILFTFGLAGKFEFYESIEGLKKHAHMNFYTADDGTNMVLSFVDYMRFGKWTPDADFSYKERGPCVLYEYKLFRENVLKNLCTSAFNKPICEALLNQKYFNGIGNYLRAEILYRCKVAPFECARTVLESLSDDSGADGDIVVKCETPDILKLCNILPLEVVQLEDSWYDGANRDDNTNGFNNWLQCYYKEGMKNLSDHNKRTIWYTGPLGPMAPKDGVTRGKKRRKSKSKTEAEDHVNDNKPVKSRKDSKKETSSVNKVKVKSKKVKIEADQQELPTDDNSDTRSCTVISSDDTSDTRSSTVISSDDILSETFHATGRLTRGQIKNILKQKSISRKLKNEKKYSSTKLKTEDGRVYKADTVDTDVRTEDIQSVTEPPKTKKHLNPLVNGAPYLHSSGQVPKENLRLHRQTKSKK